MRYLSVCSGIEAATVAWHPLGWMPVAFSEVDRFTSAVLAHRYPDVPNWGDMTKFHEWPEPCRCSQRGRSARRTDVSEWRCVRCGGAIVDLLVGGTPCQSFSIAGLRKGLSDPRGNLALTFLAIADRYRPRWVVWENVPGVLSATSHDAPDPRPPAPPMDLGCDGAEMESEDEYESEEIHAFNSLLAGFSELGYHGAYGTLDAQYFRLAQRRGRVFAVFYLGDWRGGASVLFDRESLSGHPAPRREARQGATAGALRSSDGGSDVDHAAAGHVIAGTVTSKWAKGTGGPAGDEHYNLTVAPPLNAGANRSGGSRLPGTSADDAEGLIAHALRAEGFAPMAFAENQRGDVAGSDTAGALSAGGGKPGQGYPAVAQAMAVRRLTPRECERLQGFPDDYTLIPYRGAPAKDGPRYKALGNSMAVPVMAWIGARIQMVEDILKDSTSEEIR